MAMVIKNNSAAQLALGELNKNNNKLSNSLKKVSSGMKINGAGDGASEYSISEKMRVRLRGLNQDIDNAQTGMNLIRTAEGGIQEIIDNLREMKALAINAANDHNTDIDRQTIQKEQNARLATIDDIAATTNYNGRLLLNGAYKEPVVGVTSSIPEPTGDAVMMVNGDYTISQDGVYMMPAGYEGRVTVTANNVKIVQESPDEVHINTAIECMNAGVNLWLDNVKLRVGSDNTSQDSLVEGFIDTSKNNSPLKFHGTGNTLTIRNEVSMKAGNNGSEAQIAREQYAAINVGEGLSIYGDGITSSLRASVNDGGSGRNPKGAAIGSDQGEQSSANIIISGLVFLSAWSEYGSGIGAGRSGSIGNITLNNIGTLKIGSSSGAGIGAAGGASAGDITINADEIYGTASAGGGTIVGRYSSGSVGSVTITADYIFLGAASATSSKDTTYHTEGYGTTILADSMTVNGEAFDSGGSTYSGYSNSRVYEYDGTNDSDSTEARKEELRGLVIHTGTKANENLRVFINSMDTETMGVFDILMDPIEKALEAMEKIDGALEYSLNENTRMGAYQARLSFTIDNLTVASESTQASESVIRDANMAREMTEYTKNSVLTQSAQAMLAQANQNSSGVLKLLQG